MSEMKINTLAGWFGSNRLLAQTVGAQLGKLAWCGVPFCGGCPELPHIKTRSGLCADLHRHIINLARVIANEKSKAELIDLLDHRLFHADELITAQLRCVQREEPEAALFGQRPPRVLEAPDVDWAADYFVACWMGRGGHAGKKTEFSQSCAVRFTASGGGSAKRFRSAIESLEAWHRILRNWEFIVTDCFDFLDRAYGKSGNNDREGHGLYIDAPWPDAGEEYKHTFTDRQQIALSQRLSKFQKTRVVIRFGDHPFIRDLYPEPQWTWITQASRNQQNGECSEALIINGPSHTTQPAAARAEAATPST